MGSGSDWRAVDWRAWLQARQFSAPGLQKGLEGAAIGVVLLAAAGLIWAVAAPTDSPNDGVAPIRFDASPAAFAAFDPFFRLARSDGPSAVTSLDLTLHGTRSDRVSGRGSAIIGLPDGVQNSYAVGEEIEPGATLIGVGLDNVTIRRNGANETLYLDQSGEAPVAIGSAAPAGPDPFAAIRAGGQAAPSLIADIAAEPRMRGGRIDGYVLKPGAGGTAFAAAGLLPGDVLLSIDGKRVGDGAGIEQLAGGKPVALAIERGGAVVTLTVGGGR